MKTRNVFESFNYAINGIIYGIKTQRNFKIHCILGFVALLLSLFYDLTKLEMLILVFAITLVMMAELFNTAIEKVVDMIVETYHPLAKIAKDVAAGAVLVSAFNAVIVGYVLFFNKPSFFENFGKMIVYIRQTPFHIAFIALIFIMIIVFVAKEYYKNEMPLHGGVISGHSAIAFAITTSVCFMVEDLLVMIFCAFLSFLVAQSRIEGKIHSSIQVILGAFVGIIVTLLLFSFTK